MRVGIVCCLMALGGCGSKNEACQHYAEVYTLCAHEAEEGGVPLDVDLSDPDAFCEEFEETFEDEHWDCLSKAYGEADCATEEGFAAGLAAAEGC